MTDIADYLETQWLTSISAGTAYSAAATWVALFTTLPAEDGTGGTEVSGGSYARVQVNQDGATPPYWNAPTGSPALIDNNGEIAFPQATANWGTVVGCGVYDASTAGNLLYFGSLTASQTVNNGSTFKFAAGDLDLTLD